MTPVKPGMLQRSKATSFSLFNCIERVQQEATKCLWLACEAMLFNTPVRNHSRYYYTLWFVIFRTVTPPTRCFSYTGINIATSMHPSQSAWLLFACRLCTDCSRHMPSLVTVALSQLEDCPPPPIGAINIIGGGT